jgi:hypothetical protein
MATQADVRRIALSLPATEEAPNHFAFSVRNKGKLKGFAWVWMERVAPKPLRQGLSARPGPGEVLHRTALRWISRRLGPPACGHCP